jgi:hypothetical protein
MKSKIFLTIIFGLALILSKSISYAQQMVINDFPLEDLVWNTLKGPVHAAVRTRDKSDQEKASQITVKVVPGLSTSSPIAGFDQSGHRTIWVPTGFVWILHGYSEALFMELSGFTRPHFAEWWTRYAVVRSLPGYDGDEIKRPGIYAGLKPSEYESFLQKHQALTNSIFALALADVLLHEIGHHVEDAFYRPDRNTAEEMKTAELIADEWSTNAWLGLTESGPRVVRDNLAVSLGRLVALSLLKDTYLVTYLGDDGLPQFSTHPALYDRLSNALSLEICEKGTARGSYCELAQKRLEKLVSSNSSISNYKQRAEDGEIHAFFRLGEIYLKRGDFKESCLQFSKTFFQGTYGGADNQIYNYLGWCYQNRYIRSDAPKEVTDKLAAKMFKTASKFGWLHARHQLKHFK